MKMFTKNKILPYLGYKETLMPIVTKAMSDFLVRISVNSSYIFWGIYDIAVEGFYKHNVGGFINNIPEHLSFPDDFSQYLEPYISDNFKKWIYSNEHELIIGAYYKYYIVRLPALVHYGRFIDWPKNQGVSEDNLKEITAGSLSFFEKYFPIAAKKLIGKGPGDYNSVFHEYFIGKELIRKHKYEDKKVKEFLYNNEDIWQDIVQVSPGITSIYNVYVFVESIFKSNFKMFWDSYRADYMDTLMHWNIAGAFNGGPNRDYHEKFWKSLEERIDRHEFIIRTAHPY